MTWTIGDLSARLAALAEQVAAFDQDEASPRPLVDPLCDMERWAQKHTNPEFMNRSCIDRIEKHAQSNEETYQSMIDRTDDYAEDERDIDEVFGESALSVTRKNGKIIVEESWGGPSDGYEVDGGGEFHDIDEVRYYFRDWFDGAWLEIRKSEYPATWTYLESVTSYVSEEEDE